MSKSVTRKKPNRTLVKMWNYKWIYLMLLPVMAYYIIFKYIPMYGVTIAFKDYNVFKGVLDSPWCGLEVFEKILKNKNFWEAIKNTLLLNVLTLLVSFPLTIIVSLMLNEVMSSKFKKITQSVLYLPHFISWVVVAGIATNLFSMQGGTVNHILNTLGIDSVPFLSNNAWWVFTYVICNVWKEIGWGTIIYLAALTGVDESLYEAAYLDGATKFQRLIYITLPSIKSVIVTMLILQISKMMTIGLDAPLLLGNKKVMGVSEVISTYTYRLGIERAKYSDSTAIGLFQSVINIIILFAADKFAKAIGEDGII
ncbi:putative multiple-sugar transport system permease YteP [Lachnospiraceae bacterium]|nr:sugar ABC transporter permease [Lachnospiraceae bacterium]MCI9323068.1 sugar ABC transporter permease [Lachnospiraceae bacterium]MCX4273028.1 ABC transporter permease subunit [Acetatifactor sp.]GFH95020.1 putative multiple-sugar transport system permease YteP [Lachnospiraceae bacterium]